jgi:hypothetical protein
MNSAYEDLARERVNEAINNGLKGQAINAALGSKKQTAKAVPVASIAKRTQKLIRSTVLGLLGY